MKTFALWVAVVGALLPGVAGGAVDNEAPLADAGLDQTATVGETVRLDAAGSRDPDGAIKRYEWTITVPNGSTVRPACRDCASTMFTPLRRGEYAVTVTVTDDDGATRTDTLYVTVESGEGPAVSVSGRTDPSVGESVTFTADATAGNVPLDRVTWTVDGSDGDSQQVSGDSATVDMTEEFDSPDPRRVNVTVTDVAGQEATDSVRVDPTARRARGGRGGGGGPQGYYRQSVSGGGVWVQTDEDGVPKTSTMENTADFATGDLSALDPISAIPSVRDGTGSDQGRSSSDATGGGGSSFTERFRNKHGHD